MGLFSFQVYGEEGWPFIEDSAYKVLIETILEKVQALFCFLRLINVEDSCWLMVSEFISSDQLSHELLACFTQRWLVILGML